MERKIQISLTKFSLLAVLLLVIPALLLPACRFDPTSDPQYRMGLVQEMKAFEQSVGFKPTSNFGSYSSQTQAYDYYFYAPKFDLPYSMGDPLLQFGLGTADNATIDRSQYDVFFYSIQAIASVGTPITESLMEAPLYRFIQVVFHEDCHEQVNPPLSLGEPSAEVIGYAAALQFTAQKFGPRSEVYRTLKLLSDNKLQESAVYTEYYARLTDLYSRFHAGLINEPETRRQKDELLRSMAAALRAIWGGSPELNNAFIAFQMTYERHFPLLYRVYAATGSDLKRTVEIFRAMPGQNQNPQSLDDIKNIENEVARYLQDNLEKIAPATTPVPALARGQAWLQGQTGRIAAGLPAASP